MSTYVLGFAFHEETQSVALVHKLHGPAPVINKWNGIGGHVEEGEPALMAMRREFEEETGVMLMDWTRFCALRVKAYDALIYCYRIYLSGKRPQLQQKTDERVDWHFWNLEVLPVVPNLRWLIPMARDKDKLSAFVDDNTPGCT